MIPIKSNVFLYHYVKLLRNFVARCFFQKYFIFDFYGVSFQIDIVLLKFETNIFEKILKEFHTGKKGLKKIEG